MRRLLCHLGFMIAPDGGVGKSLAGGFDATNIHQIEPCFCIREHSNSRNCDICDRWNHAIVRSIILRP